MVIVTSLSGFISLSLVKEQNITSVNASVDTLVANMASQQTKAMVSKSEGLPIGHPYFGKLLLCECARIAETKLLEQDDNYLLPAENWPRGKRT